jgi:hypothetical protein
MAVEVEMELAVIWLIGFWLTLGNVRDERDEDSWDFQLMFLLMLLLMWPYFLGARLRK